MVGELGVSGRRGWNGGVFRVWETYDFGMGAMGSGCVAMGVHGGWMVEGMMGGGFRGGGCEHCNWDLGAWDLHYGEDCHCSSSGRRNGEFSSKV